VGDRKSVLLIAYYFPPHGMAGVGRSRALFKYLPQYGYDVKVLTVKSIVYPQYDNSLLETLDNTRIYRAGSFDPARILYLAGMRKQKKSAYPSIAGKFPFYLPDLKRGWLPFAFRKARKIIRRHDIKIVITSSPPPSSHLLGLKLKSILPIKWIADFRDFWFPLPIEKIYPPGFIRNYSLKLKRKIMEHADEIVSVNGHIREYLARGEVIRNGADETSSQGWHKNISSASDRFTIGLLGTFGQLVPLKPLFDSFKLLQEKNNNLADKIRFLHVGHCDREMMQLINEYSLAERIELKGYLEQSKAVETMSQADILYLGIKKIDNYHVLPGRIFYYLVSGKPIIGAVSSESEMAHLLNEYSAGFVAEDSHPQKIADLIVQLFDDLNSGRLPQADSTALLEQYSTRTMARKYAALFDRMTQ
jgi:glycosyltransferase involved in cell wall biosynthesis